jgi:beta propeller repeat protein
MRLARKNLSYNSSPPKVPGQTMSRWLWGRQSGRSGHIAKAKEPWECKQARCIQKGSFLKKGNWVFYFLEERMRFGVVMGLLVSTAVWAQTFTVAKDGTGDFSTIQEAIDEAWDGDTIVVYPGWYNEQVFFNGRAVLLTSTNPDDPNVVAATVIQGTVTFDFLEGMDSILSGFTIVNPIFTPSEFAVCTAEGYQGSPSIWGDIVVWTDSRNGNYDIYGCNLRTGEEFAVCTAEGGQYAPSIWGDIVVWEDWRNGYSDIYGCNLRTGEEFAVCTAEEEQGSPSIWGDIVVWQDYRNGYSDIYGCNLRTGQEFAVCTAEGYQWSPSIWGDIVVWQDSRNGYSDIYGCNLATGKEFAVCTAEGYQWSPSIWGDIVVWQESGQIYAFNLTTGQEFAVCTAGLAQQYPSISGDIVVWQDYRNGNNNDIYRQEDKVL